MSEFTVITAPVPTELPAFTQLPNLADPRLGAVALSASDEFFAAKERMLNPEPAVFIVGKYDDHGKWMDGWETRRRRGMGHDHVVVRLARPARLRGVDIDTSHFTGNYPPAASLDGCYVASGDPTAQSVWTELLPASALQGHQHHLLPIHGDQLVTHVRLNIFPDGGVARLRLYGQIEMTASSTERLDLVALLNGGRAVACNDAHFGQPVNLLLPQPAQNMGEGWETRRRREPGHDWCILALGQAGHIDQIEIETHHFKGNYPDRVSIQAAYLPDAIDASLVTQSMFWPLLLAEQPLFADQTHQFEPLAMATPITHVRINIHPDGGLSRVRLWGRREVSA
ncbi:MAG: allantoicase [Pseudomonadota bacterium]|nr:allantoicase [Pseudomonadota bacterium]